MEDVLNAVDGPSAALTRAGGVDEHAGVLTGIYKVQHVGPAEADRARYIELRDALEVVGGADPILEAELAKIPLILFHEEEFHNLVTTVGKNLMLDTILAGSAFTATVVMGLCGTGTKAAADTQSSHAGWNEVGLANAPTYSGNRKTPTFSSASAGSKATSASVSFSITSSGTVAGCFININGSATVDNTTGTLLSAGDFTGGSRAVVNGDTLNVTYSLAI